MLTSLIRRMARRCPTHDRASYSKTRQLEESLGMEPSAPPDSFVDAYSNPDIIDCGISWCRQRASRRW